MGYASISGRARTSPRSPAAHAICDRCGARYNHNALKWQFDWAGAGLINKRLLVCNSCYDKPQENIRSVVIPADPMPILNPRVQNFATAETNQRYTSGQNTTDALTGLPIVGGNLRITEADAARSTQATGEPPYGTNQEPGTSIMVPDDIGGDDPGLPYGYTEVPKTGPLT